MRMDIQDVMFCLPVMNGLPPRAADKHAAKTPVKTQKGFSLPGKGSGYLLAERIARADFKASA